MNLNGLHIHTDCRFFKGDLPCNPHKNHGVQCSNCMFYEKIENRVLIIKLGAIGDVIRTTPLLRKIKQEIPNAKITWLTLTPAILPKSEIDEILPFDLKSIIYLQNTTFDYLYNLDKDKEACALYNSINAQNKYGYALENGIAVPSNSLAFHKYSTGIFDDISKANTKPYVQEIFEMCDWEFNHEEYVFENHQDKGYKWNLDKSKPLIGLNTGCGDRWTTRLWSDEKWISLITRLQKNGFTPILLGGQQEDERNKVLSNNTGATYLGYFPLPQFINLMYQMDVIVTQVTMAMHIAIALQKKMVLMNNIFNPYEFDLYNRGFIVAPEKKCKCFYKGSCIDDVSCMENLSAESVFEKVKLLIN